MTARCMECRWRNCICVRAWAWAWAWVCVQNGMPLIQTTNSYGNDSLFARYHNSMFTVNLANGSYIIFLFDIVIGVYGPFSLHKCHLFQCVLCVCASASAPVLRFCVCAIVIDCQINISHCPRIAIAIEHRSKYRKCCKETENGRKVKWNRSGLRFVFRVLRTRARGGDITNRKWKKLQHIKTDVQLILL